MSELPGVDHWLWAALVCAWGALWGSFLNVVIYRLPRDLSVVSPGSRCGACETAVPWYHNIPVLSWFVLRGRCYKCKAPFSIRYPLVEAAVAVLSLAVWMKLIHPAGGAPPDLADALVAWSFLFVFVALMVSIALIDLDTMLIPDVLSLPGIPLGLLAAWIAAPVTGVNLEQSLLGLLLGGGSLFLITYGYLALTGREGMGLGDYRLMGLVGAFLGWKALLFLMVGSAVQGIIFALVARFTGLEEALPKLSDFDDVDVAEGDDLRHMAIPFGPFIALAALEWLVFERPLLALFNTYVFQPVAG